MNEHHVIGTVMTPHRKNGLTWFISMYHVIGLKQTLGVTLKAPKHFLGAAVYQPRSQGLFPGLGAGRGKGPGNEVGGLLERVVRVVDRNILFLRIIYVFDRFLS